MTVRNSIVWLFFICALVLWAAPVLQAADLPLPDMVVTKTSAPPKIDGVMSPGEWDQAAACTAFTIPNYGKDYYDTLCRIQTVAYMTYDDTYFYFCIKDLRAKDIDLLTCNGRKPDDAGTVFDTSNEIWISPPSSPAETYQVIFNTYPAVYDVKMIPQVGYTSLAWSGHWELASSQDKDFWTIEARVPISSFSKKHPSDGDVWRALFAADLGTGGGFRAWAPGGGFAEIQRHGFIHFKDNSPVFQMLDVEKLFRGAIDFPMAVTGPTNGSSTVTVGVRFGADLTAAPGDQTFTKTVTVADKRVETFRFTGELAAKSGVCEVTAKTSDGTVLYHQIFPFINDGFVRTPPEKLRQSPYSTPLGLTAHYAPNAKKLLVAVDRLYLPERLQAVSGVARLKDPKTGAVVAESQMTPFHYDLSEFPMDTSKLNVPVQTEADWKAGKQDMAEYTLEVTANSQDGKPLATTSIPVKLMGYSFEWQNNNVGISDKVIAPWTPVEYKDGRLSMWNKSYRMNALGLAEQIVNSNEPQLSGPMKFEAVIDGKAQVVKAGKPTLVKLTEAAADLHGVTKLGGLEIAVDTRAEFDGFVKNTMTIDPKSPTKLDSLSLIVTMPASEAPCFVTTSGGWGASFGWTPEKWDSRETALGSMTYNFVPYILLTDSERGFCFFTDSTKGWILDSERPTQEISRTADAVTMRVNFVSKAGVIDHPTTLVYGWMVTPQKPQPSGWRACNIGFSKPFAQANYVFYTDADWAVSWPYYSSPYPWHYDKSKVEIDQRTKMGVKACVGNIAHAIARYQDYKGRRFPELATDWGITPGNDGDGNVVRCRDTNDFQVWHWDQWVKKSGLPGLYFDENYLGEDWNYLNGGAYRLPDGKIEPGYNYMGLREMDKRLRYMFAANGMTRPNLWLHTTCGQPVYAWMPDIAMEGENVCPTGRDGDDYLNALPAFRLRSLDMGRNLGSVPVVMCQASGQSPAEMRPYLTAQFVGWVLAHDCLPVANQTNGWETLDAELGMWRDDIRFLPYWKSGTGITSLTEDVVVSAHARPGETVLWVVNTSRKDVHAQVKLDLARIGLNPGQPTTVFDAETGEPYPFSAGKLSVDVPRRMWRAVRLVQSKYLGPDTTFVAHFEDGTGADGSLGYGYPESYVVGVKSKAIAAGKTGQGLSLDAAQRYRARHNLPSVQGSLSCQLYFDTAKSHGQIFTFGKIAVQIGSGLMRVYEGDNSVAESKLPDTGAPAWHTVKISWAGSKLTAAIDSSTAAATLGAPFSVKMGRVGSSGEANLQLGPIAGAVMDDLVISRR